MWLCVFHYKPIHLIVDFHSLCCDFGPYMIKFVWITGQDQVLEMANSIHLCFLMVDAVWPAMSTLLLVCLLRWWTPSPQIVTQSKLSFNLLSARYLFTTTKKVAKSRWFSQWDTQSWSQGSYGTLPGCTVFAGVLTTDAVTLDGCLDSWECYRNLPTSTFRRLNLGGFSSRPTWAT